MKEITDQTLAIHSNGKGMIVLKWPDMQVHLTIDNANKLIDGLQKAIKFENEIKAKDED